MTPDYYDAGRTAAEAGRSLDDCTIPRHTVDWRDWRRGFEDYLQEQSLPATQPFLDLELLEIAGTGDA